MTAPVHLVDTTPALFDAAMNAYPIEPYPGYNVEQLKHGAEGVYAAIWGLTNNLPVTIEGAGPDEVEFIVTGARFTGTILLGPTGNIPVPGPLTTSFTTLDQEIIGTDNGWGDAAPMVNWIDQAWGPPEGLGLGASAFGNELGWITTTVEYPTLTAQVTIAPNQTVNG